MRELRWNCHLIIARLLRKTRGGPRLYRAARGFTLIEVLVGTLLMALMGTLLMTTINSSLQAKETVDEISNRYQMVRQAMSRMAREISMAYLSKHMSLSEPSFVTQFKGKRDSLYFSAFGNVIHHRDAKQSDQQVLGFYLATDKNGQQSLMRRVQPNLNLDVEKGGHAQVLCPNVSKLEFMYFDNRFKKWDETWLSDPTAFAASGQLEDSKDKDAQAQAQNASLPKPWRLPNFVKITMTVEMQRDNPMTWVVETEIPIQEPLDLH